MGGLDADVLVLNRLWQAVNVVPARRALSLVYVGRGKFVERDFSTSDWSRWTARPVPPGRSYVEAVDRRIRLPRVVQLIDYDRVPSPRIKFTRANVYLRDRHRCQYCGSRGHEARLTLDHVQPRSRGGRTTWRNIVVSCMPCNSHKRDRLPEEAGMRLLRPPRQPRWHPVQALRSSVEPPPEWLPFLSWMQENQATG